MAVASVTALRLTALYAAACVVILLLFPAQGVRGQVDGEEVASLIDEGLAAAESRDGDALVAALDRGIDLLQENRDSIGDLVDAGIAAAEDNEERVQALVGFGASQLADNRDGIREAAESGIARLPDNREDIGSAVQSGIRRLRERRERSGESLLQRALGRLSSLFG